MPTKFCKDCSLKLGFFKKKTQCRMCMYHYCDQCFSKVKENEVDLFYKLKTLTVPACLQCVVLKRDVIKRNEVLLLGSKHLTEFLGLKNIPMKNCTEKYHLVDLIMEFAETNGYISGHDIENETMRKQHIEGLRQAEMTRQLEEIRKKREQELQSRSEVNIVEPEPESMPQLQENAPNDDTLQTEHRDENTEVLDFDCNTSTDNLQGSTQQSDNVDGNHTEDSPGFNISSSEQVEPSNHRNSSNNQESVEPTSSTSHNQEYVQPTSSIHGQNSTSTNQSHFDQSSTQPDQRLSQANGFWRSIEDVTDEKEIRSLSVLELKQILTANFMDYRGCCEKKELIDKVKMLYKSVEKFVGNEASTTYESDTCKICMDHIIDCVLLDCGHLVACTKCGKQLAQCPICRAFVVRVVHVFRV